MAKNPAFLFYPNDWQGGTMTMSRHLKGCYLDLLIAQFNSGPLSLEDIRTILGSDFPAWNTLQKKFAQNATGKFFNERLKLEQAKREHFSKKQKERIQQRWKNKPPDRSIGNTAVLPVENEDESENENRNETVNENQGDARGKSSAGANAVEIPSMEMITGLFTNAGFKEAEGEAFYLLVSGTKGWENIHHWRDYVLASLKQKLNQKSTARSGQFTSERDARRQSIKDLEELAREILRQP